jgi:hypothetical protein
MTTPDLLIDLQQTFPIDVDLPQSTYTNEKTFKKKFNMASKALLKSIRLKNRTLSLVNAYYVGKLLDELSTSSERFQYKKKLTAHYATIAERTFNIFEPCSTQIMKTSLITVQVIRKMKQSQVLELRNEMFIFAGAQNLKEELVTLDENINYI